MKKIKKISDFNLSLKKVLVRLDLNIPFHNETIIKEMLSEIKDIFSVP